MPNILSLSEHRKLREESYKCRKSKYLWMRVFLFSLIAALVSFLAKMPFITIGCLLMNFVFLGLYQQAKFRILEIRLLKSKIYNAILMDRANG